MKNRLPGMAQGVPDPRGRLNPRGTGWRRCMPGRTPCQPAGCGPPHRRAARWRPRRSPAAQAQQEEKGGRCQARVRRFEQPLPGPGWGGRYGQAGGRGPRRLRRLRWQRDSRGLGGAGAPQPRRRGGSGGGRGGADRREEPGVTGSPGRGVGGRYVSLVSLRTSASRGTPAQSLFSHNPPPYLIPPFLLLSPPPSSPKARTSP